VTNGPDRPYPLGMLHLDVRSGRTPTGLVAIVRGPAK